MKRRLILLLLLATTAGAVFAQKEYVNVVSIGKFTSNGTYSHVTSSLSGDVPEDFYSYNFLYAGTIVSKLSQYGFSVEKMSSSTNDTYMVETILLSRDTASTETKISQVKADTPDTETTEVARYNLQGLPVKESDKGLQIIVYSNYTTKTVLVE